MAAVTRRVLAPDFHLPQAKAGRAGNCVFALSAFPKGALVRFDVTPLECFGRRGKPIHSQAFPIPV